MIVMIKVKSLTLVSSFEHGANASGIKGISVLGTIKQMTKVRDRSFRLGKSLQL